MALWSLATQGVVTPSCRAKARQTRQGTTFPVLSERQDMKQIAQALVKAQTTRHTPEGRMTEAVLLRSIAPSRRFNQHTAPDMTSRFMSHVMFGASDCWYWVGSTDDLGYGRFSYSTENKAHRAAFRIFKGDIPQGMKVLHKCDTRCCVNPEHLTLGTQKQNMQDMVAKGRNRCVPQHGEKNPMSRLTRAQVEEIRRRVAEGETQRSMCAIFNVSPMTINRIVRKESWQ